MARTDANSTAASAPGRGLARRLGWLFGGLAVLAVCLVIRGLWGAGSATAAPRDLAPEAQPGDKPAGPQQPEQKMQYVAIVNGERISRNDLAREALRHYGDEVLDAMINKRLILGQCQKYSITITREEVGDEIGRMAERFGLSPERWMEMLEGERNISPAQYANEIIWPSLALRKLAASRLQVSEDEIQQAYDTQFGPSVQVRIIAIHSAETARKVHAAAMKNPDNFGDLAKQYSEDINSASVKGLVQPIHRHQGDPRLEQAAFSLQPGGISPIIQVEDQFVFIKCEKHFPATNVPMDKKMREILEAGWRDKKMRLVANDVFAAMQKESRVVNIYRNPELRQQYPGQAAEVNGEKITILDLAEECITRNGKQVLEGTINRRLLEQACKQKKIEVSDQEINAEIARAAISMGKTKSNGEPDLEAWFKEVVDKQKTTLEIYRYDVVWPTVALKKLVDVKIEITEDDISRGFEANYGERARVRAIVLNHPRKAQEVWEMARTRLTAQFFGDLAEEYSVEPGSRALRGEIPPIAMHGGQPQLEKEAFTLHEGELSSVINVGDKWVILFGEGRTKPVGVKKEEVRQLIYDDIYEKKLRHEMAREFTRIQGRAEIDNYLAGTSQSPNRGKNAGDWGHGTSVSRVPHAKKPDPEGLDSGVPETLRKR